MATFVIQQPVEERRAVAYGARARARIAARGDADVIRHAHQTGSGAVAHRRQPLAPRRLHANPLDALGDEAVTCGSRSSSAGSPKATSTTVPALRPTGNGTPPPGERSWKRRAARCSTRKANRSVNQRETLLNGDFIAFGDFWPCATGCRHERARTGSSACSGSSAAALRSADRLSVGRRQTSRPSRRTPSRNLRSRRRDRRGDVRATSGRTRRPAAAGGVPPPRMAQSRTRSRSPTWSMRSATR